MHVIQGGARALPVTPRVSLADVPISIRNLRQSLAIDEIRVVRVLAAQVTAPALKVYPRGRRADTRLGEHAHFCLVSDDMAPSNPGVASSVDHLMELGVVELCAESDGKSNDRMMLRTHPTILDGLMHAGRTGVPPHVEWCAVRLTPRVGRRLATRMEIIDPSAP